MATEPATETKTKLKLDPPEALQPVAPAEAAGLVPLKTEETSELDKRVGQFVDELSALDSNSPEFGKKVDQLTAMGRKEIAEAAGASNRFLDRPVKAIDKDTGIGADLTELRRTVEALDPKEATKTRKILGIIPFGNRIDRYFDKYRSSQTHISKILSSLGNGKDELLMDNAAIDTERANLWKTMHKLEQMVHISKTLDQRLEDKANELDATEPAKAKAIRETALFYTRQRTTDLLTQMAVTVQGYLALDLVKKNNVELVKGVDRASTTTVAALRTAVTVAQAMTNQKLVLEQVTALNTTTASMIDSTGEMLRTQTGAIHEQAAVLDHPAGDAAARLPEHLRHHGPDRSVQASGAGQHEADGRHPGQGSREVEGLYRKGRGREPGQARRRSLAVHPNREQMNTNELGRIFERANQSFAQAQQVSAKVDRSVTRADDVMRRADERGGAVRAAAQRERQRLNSDLAGRAKRVGIAIGVISLATIVVGLIVPIGMFGFLAAVGLAIGIAAVLAVKPASERGPAAPSADLPNGEMVQRFDSYLYRARAALPPPAQAEVDAISSILPSLRQTLERVDTFDPNAQDARRLMSIHLPALLDRYVQVPVAYRNEQDGEGKTADERLVEALSASRAALGDISQKLARADLAALETQGRFMTSRYGEDGPQPVESASEDAPPHTS